MHSIPVRIEKPARYAGGELNSVYKENADIDFALCFPDVYEIGMSNVGIALLYEILNGTDTVYCQRCFSPWPDMGQHLKENSIPLYSLEEGKPLRDFDIVGFNLAYELSYTNIVYMLDLAQIPFYARDRGDAYPVIVGGGSCASNPEPVADFFDVFILGDGEEAIVRLCNIVYQAKKAGASRKELLDKLASERGFYVPSRYTVSYEQDGKIKSIQADGTAPERVVRNYLKDFDGAVCIKKPVLPFISTVFDRCTLEIMRGCTRGCRFCQAGYIYRPVRERSSGILLDEAECVLASTGYDEISLSSLSSGDYSEIVPLATALLDKYESKKVSVSLPSLRVDSFSPEVAEKLESVRHTGFTFAPEAGTQRLRDVINKNVTDDDIYSSTDYAIRAGARTVKLYFMIGLPTETYDDLDGIVTIVKNIRKIYYDTPREIRSGALSINVSVSGFVPKPQTPFMWFGQNTREEFLRKQQYLKQRLSIKGVKFSYHDSDISFLEAVFARGDRRLAAVIEKAYLCGCKFDSWKDMFDISKWLSAFSCLEIDPEWYANRERYADEVFPFDHLDYMIDRKYLIRELEKAKKGETTADCRGNCNACGIHNYGCVMNGEKNR